MTKILKEVYLDYNATTPLAPPVLQGIEWALKNCWANPSSSYRLGKEAKEAMERGRTFVSEMLNISNAEQILFTSGGTESNQLVIHSAVEHFKHRNVDHGLAPHIICSKIEHPSVLHPLEKLEKEGLIELSKLAPNQDGQILPSSLGEIVKPNTVLISVMMANNETGVIMDIAGISSWLRNYNTLHRKKDPILFHTDAAQALGKVIVDVERLQVDYLTVVGHKFYGPRIGALYVKGLNRNKSSSKGILYPMFQGGGQEMNYRSGTENVGFMVGLGIAAELVSKNIHQYSHHLLEMRNYLEESLISSFGTSRIMIHCYQSGENTLIPRLPNTTNVSILFRNPKISSRHIINSLKGVFISGGAACHSGNSVSQVLLDSGVDPSHARTALRISVGRETTKTDIDIAICELKRVVAEIDETCSFKT